MPILTGTMLTREVAQVAGPGGHEETSAESRNSLHGAFEGSGEPLLEVQDRDQIGIAVDTRHLREISPSVSNQT